MRPATIAAHAGRPGGPGAPLNPPIDLSSTYRDGGPRVYGRDDNATWEAFEAGLGALEGGAALVFSLPRPVLDLGLTLVPWIARWLNNRPARFGRVLRTASEAFRESPVT